MPLYLWSHTAASNGSIDSSVNFQEGQAPSSLNDSGRAVMARVAEFRDDTAGSLLTAGTSTAYTVSTNQVFDTLAHLHGQTLVVRFHVANGAAPTLNVDGLGAKPIQVSSGVAVGTGVIGAGVTQVTYDNTIPAFLVQGIPAIVQDGTVGTQSIAAAAVTSAKIATGGVAAVNIANNVISSLQLANNGIMAGPSMLNGTLVQSQSGGAQTFAVKTLAGADPSAADPVLFIFSNAPGGYSVVQATAALSVTIPSGKSIGTTSATPCRVWLGAINNAGTVELFVVNCLTITLASGVPTAVNIYPLQPTGYITTTAVSGATSAGIPYSTTARSIVSSTVLGFYTWEAGATNATAGTWITNAGRVQLYNPANMALPGQLVQLQYNLTNTTTNINGANIQTASTFAITPTSSANLIEASADFNVAATGAFGVNARLSRGAVPTYFGSLSSCNVNSALNFSGHLYGMDFPATLSATNYFVYGTQISGPCTYNSSGNAVISGREIMA